jgi:hypothetical protein
MAVFAAARRIQNGRSARFDKPGDQPVHGLHLKSALVRRQKKKAVGVFSKEKLPASQMKTFRLHTDRYRQTSDFLRRSFVWRPPLRAGDNLSRRQCV